MEDKIAADEGDPVISEDVAKLHGIPKSTQALQKRFFEKKIGHPITYEEYRAMYLHIQEWNRQNAIEERTKKMARPFNIVAGVMMVLVVVAIVIMVITGDYIWEIIGYSLLIGIYPIYWIIDLI